MTASNQYLAVHWQSGPLFTNALLGSLNARPSMRAHVFKASYGSSNDSAPSRRVSKHMLDLEIMWLNLCFRIPSHATRPSTYTRTQSSATSSHPNLPTAQVRGLLSSLIAQANAARKGLSTPKTGDFLLEETGYGAGKTPLTPQSGSWKFGVAV
jgi:hypothetical protein